MPGADEIHSPLWKEQQWLTGSQRAKNKSGLSRRWCAARVPLVVSPCAAWFAHTFLMSHKRLLALMLIHLLMVFCVRAAALEATRALAEVVNSGFVRHQQKNHIWQSQTSRVKAQRVLWVWRDRLVSVEQLNLTSWSCTGIIPTWCVFILCFMQKHNINVLGAP